MLTQETLKQLLSYNPETGQFTWLVRKARRIKVGDVAGSSNKLGYRCIEIDGKNYLAHRLAFLYMTGTFPPEDVDHIDHNPANNSWENLRPVSTAENSRNTTSRSGSSSKYLGVHWHKKCQKWRASIRINGKTKHIGLFIEEADAAQAYNFAAYKHFGDFSNLNTPIKSSHLTLC